MPIIKQTIGKHAKNIRYYSDVADASIPTEYIDVENTERGHCQKLYNIIERSTRDEWKDKKWLVVIDDDTVMKYVLFGNIPTRKLVRLVKELVYIHLGFIYGKIKIVYGNMKLFFINLAKKRC